MPSTPNTQTVSFDNLGGILGSLEVKGDNLDPRARQQAALLAFGRRANARPDLTVLMQDAVALVAEILEADLSGTAEVVEAGTKLVLRVGGTDRQGQPVKPQAYETPLGRAEGEEQNSMAAYALNLASPVASPDLAAETRFSDLFLRNLGVRSAIAVPLHLNAEPFGALGVYSREGRPFGQEDVHFAETIAHLLTSSIARVHSERALAEQRTLLKTVLSHVDALVIALDVEGNVSSMNAAGERIAGFKLAEVRGKPIVGRFAVPREADLLQLLIRRAVNAGTGAEFEGCLLTKDGRQRRIAWSLQAIFNEHRYVQSLVLTGIDRTAEIEAVEEARRARAAAAESAQALRELRQAMAEEPTSGAGAARPLAPQAAADADRERDAAWGGPGFEEALERAAAGTDAASVERGSSSDDRAAAAPAPPEPAERHPFQPVVGPAGGPPANEQRSSPRRTYQYQQLIAPVTGRGMPSRKKFFPVTCEDISAGGLSFLLDAPPDFQDLVVALGKSPTLTYFAARVVRYAETKVEGQTLYLVGCRFSGRVATAAIEG